MSAPPPRSFTRLAISIVIAAIVIAAALFASLSQRTETTASISTTTQTITRTTTETVTTTATSTIAASSAEDCSQAQAPKSIGLLFGAVFAGTSSPAIICVQLYYFNSTSYLTLNPQLELTIQGVRASLVFKGAPNFTVSSGLPQLTLGGPNNENEGAIIAFGVTANPGASGTYELSFGGYMLTPSGQMLCGSYGELVAGDGSPNYVLPGGCEDIGVSRSGTSSSLAIPGIQYTLLDNQLYFRVVGATNSTS